MTDHKKDFATEIDDSALDAAQGGGSRLTTASPEQTVTLNKVELLSGAGVSPFREVQTTLDRDQVGDEVGRVGANPTPHP